MMSDRHYMNEDKLGFWDWSLKIYGESGLSEKLIALQDDYELDVNIALWACWSGLSHGALPPIVIRKAIALCADWASGVVFPLRSARRALKAPPQQADATGAENLRSSVKTLELEAERLQQGMLEALSTELSMEPEDPAQPMTSARRNLMAYISLAEIAHKPGFSLQLASDVLDLIEKAENRRAAGDAQGGAA